MLMFEDRIEERDKETVILADIDVFQAEEQS